MSLILKSVIRHPQNSRKLIRVISATLGSRTYCQAKNAEPANDEAKLSGFAKAFDKHTEWEKPQEVQNENYTFASLLRNSKFIDMGDPDGKVVTGKVFHVVDDDLYIDFGWKFHCVCPRPTKNAMDYVRGAKVRLRVKDLELSTRFLGSEKDLTILEADCQLLGLISSPARPQRGSVVQ